jgi:hypothetical protein
MKRHTNSRYSRIIARDRFDTCTVSAAPGCIVLKRNDRLKSRIAHLAGDRRFKWSVRGGNRRVCKFRLLRIRQKQVFWHLGRNRILSHNRTIQGPIALFGIIALLRRNRIRTTLVYTPWLISRCSDRHQLDITYCDLYRRLSEPRLSLPITLLYFYLFVST